MTTHTHSFHIDHAAALPHVLERTTFKGRTFMTHPTRAIFKIIVLDYVRVSNVGADNNIFDAKDVENCISKIELVRDNRIAMTLLSN